MTERHGDSTKWPGEEEDHRALADAYVRIDEARSTLQALEAAVGDFVQQTVRMMASGWSAERNSFVVSLPPAHLSHEGKVPPGIHRMCADIVEDLRAALDYGVMVVATRTKPDITPAEERRVSFVIARSKEGFTSQAPTALKYVGADLRHWMEQMQPYHGNQVLEFIGDASGSSKHRRLPKVKHATELTIVLKEHSAESNWEEQGWNVLPAGEGHVFLARANQTVLRIHERYDALVVFPICIDHVQGIIDDLELYLQHGHLPPGHARLSK